MTSSFMSRTRGKSININTKTWRKKRSSAYPAHMRWLAFHPAADVTDDNDDDDNSWLDDALRRLSDAQQSPQIRNSSPFTKRIEEYQRRVDRQEEKGAGGEDWDSNGWIREVWENTVRLEPNHSCPSLRLCETGTQMVG